MRFAIRFAEAVGVVEITLEGEPCPEGFRAMTERLMSDPRYRSGLALLVDCTELVTPSLSQDEILFAVSPVIERDWHYPPRAVAVIAPHPATYQFAIHARAHMGGSSINRKVFTDSVEARDWLNEQLAEPPAPHKQLFSSRR